MRRIYKLVRWRDSSEHNFIWTPELRKLLNKPNCDFWAAYRNYATLFFVFIMDDVENHLAVLDLIQVSFGGAVLHRRLDSTPPGICRSVGPCV